MRFIQFLQALSSISLASCLTVSVGPDRRRSSEHRSMVISTSNPYLAPAKYHNTIEPRNVARSMAPEEDEAIRERATGRAQHFVDHFLQDQGGLDYQDTCIALRSVEWLAYSLIAQTAKIQSENGNHIFVDPEEQSGHLVLVLRGLLYWDNILLALQTRLGVDSPWTVEGQTHVSQCYLDYASQADAWLGALSNRSQEFKDDNDVSCLVNDRVEKLGIKHAAVSELLYGDNIKPGLLLGDFPEKIPQWNPRLPTPQSGERINAYTQKNDITAANSMDKFDLTAAKWVCEKNTDGEPDPNPIASDASNGTKDGGSGCPCSGDEDDASKGCPCSGDDEASNGCPCSGDEGSRCDCDRPVKIVPTPTAAPANTGRPAPFISDLFPGVHFAERI